MNNRTLALTILGVILAFSLAVDFGVNPTGKVDDWQYSGQSTDIPAEPVRIAGEYATANMFGQTYKSLGTGLINSPGLAIGIVYVQFQSLTSAQYAQSSLQSQQELGYATGGAKDINNFRDNIENNYLPLTSDISYEGLFYEYYFDTGQNKVCKELFCPSYSKAVSKDPLKDETEYFTTVGLNSNMNEDEFERKKLNLVIVMDISGSMDSGFDNYYYDKFGTRKEVENATDDTKMQVAKKSLQGLTTHLRANDRVGVVLFNDDAAKAKPLNKVENVDMDAIRDHMSDIEADGGTNMDAGMRKASEMLEKHKNADKSEYENRVIFMTDAMPNIGRTSDEGLLYMTEQNAEEGIHTSFVGMGVDFNTELIDEITSIRGANYFSVHSSEQFKNRMDRDFKYMVTPLVYNLTLRMDSDKYSIEKVYGSTAAEKSTGQLMKVNTLFPSRSKEGKTKGGVVLVKLEKQTENTGILNLEVNYENREGEIMENTQKIEFGSHEPEYFENTGIRKAVVLSRYAELMKSWIRAERDNETRRKSLKEEESRYRRHPRLGEQERQSEPLTVSDEYRKKMKEFKDNLQTEMEIIGDEKMEQEVEMINKILAKSD